MYLPGTLGERIGDLRTSKGISKAELAKKVGFTAPHMGRVERGVQETINSDSLIKMAKLFNVSTDYILGLSTISTPKSHEISELGLSEKAAMPLIKKSYDITILNRLLEHKDFPVLIKFMKIYFEDTHVAGIKSFNDIINTVNKGLEDFKPDSQEHINLLTTQKMGEHEADIERIKSRFMKIIKEIKKDIENAVPISEPIGTDFYEKIKADVEDTPQEEMTAESMSNATMEMFNNSGILKINENNKDGLLNFFTEFYKQHEPPKEE